MTTLPDEPEGLAAGGTALWRALLVRDAALADDLSPMRDVALSACRTKDRCDALDAIVRREPTLLTDRKGHPLIHPAMVEARLQANALKQLMAALRLPDLTTGRRPQHRGARGAYRSSFARRPSPRGTSA